MVETSTRVAIIGGGSSGLAAIKECLEQNLDVVCFEQGSDVGGFWRYEEPVANKEVHSSVYRNTVINTSKPMMAFSDFPIPTSWPTFLHNKSVLEYFEDYANHFNLRRYIKFNSKVLSVHPLGKAGNEDGAGQSHDGQWEVVYSDSSSTTPHRTFNEVFDKVIIATGHHWKPNTPKLDGMSQFKGEVLHSHYYRDPAAYKDKKCLVLGIGNSGVDLAVEASYTSKMVYISSRRSAWVAPRYALFGTPADQVLNRVFFFLPLFLRNWIFKLSLWLQYGNSERYGLVPKHEPFSAHPTVHGELCARIGTGTIKLVKNIKRFLPDKGNGAAGKVELEDGTILDVDAVFLCTGYEIGYPFLDARRICGLEPGTNRVNMYKFIWPLKHKNIAFIGLVQPYGSIIPISELQCRWVTQVFAKSAKALPSEQVMMKDVQKVRQDMESRYLTSQRHTIQVDAGPYMDDIGSQMGVKPNLWRYLLKDPLLWIALVLGNWNPFQYRLEGPGAWSGARSEIFKSNASFDYRFWKGF